MQDERQAQRAPLVDQEATPEPVASSGGRLSVALAWGRALVSAALYVSVALTFGGQTARVRGSSMRPTLLNSDRVLVNKAVYTLRAPLVGEIVMFYNPLYPDVVLVKRIVAAPGDDIASVGGRLYRNGLAVRDGFIGEEFRRNDTWGPETVRPGCYFVMGDHRKSSLDSRSFGCVPRRYIIGKVHFRWWPVVRARVFSDFD